MSSNLTNLMHVPDLERTCINSVPKKVEDRVLVPPFQRTSTSTRNSITTIPTARVISYEISLYKDLFKIETDKDASAKCKFAERLSKSWKSSDENDECIPEAKMIIPAKLGYNSTYASQETYGISRPSFVFCQVIKPTIDYPIAISFKQGEDGTIRICNIDDGGIFARTGCLQPGDEVVAINGLSTTGVTAWKATNILKNAFKTISITAKTINGDPNQFLSSIEKPKKCSRVGINLRNVSRKGNVLTVESIEEKGIFSTSLLAPGHQILTINGIDCCMIRSSDVADLINNTNSVTNNKDDEKHYHINILSKVQSNTRNGVATIVCYDCPMLITTRSFLRYNHMKKKIRRIVSRFWVTS